MTPVLFGLCLLLAGWLAARAVAAGERRRIAARLDVARRAETRGGRSFHPRLVRVLASAGAAAIGWVVLGPVGSLAGAAVPFAARRWASATERARLDAAVQAQVADVVVAISAGLRAGLSPRLAVQEAARDAQPPLSDAMSAVLDALELGEPLDEALTRLAPRLGDVALVANVLRIHRRTGGDLPSLLDRVAVVIGERAAERRHLRAMTAQATASGAVLAALPVAFIALLSGVGGGGLGDFYRSSLGALLLSAGLALDALGFLWMRRIVRGVREAP